MSDDTEMVAVVYPDPDFRRDTYFISEEEYEENPGEYELAENDRDEAGEVTFASEAAAELAEDEGLGAEDFEDVEASGKTGYTKPDVESLID